MLSDAAAADRAAFLKREARQSWGVRLVEGVQVVVGLVRHRLFRVQGLRVRRARGADGLDYLVVSVGPS